MANITSNITGKTYWIKEDPSDQEYLRRLRGAIMTKSAPKIRETSRKIRVSSDHELRRLAWGI